MMEHAGGPKKAVALSESCALPCKPVSSAYKDADERFTCFSPPWRIFEWVWISIKWRSFGLLLRSSLNVRSSTSRFGPHRAPKSHPFCRNPEDTKIHFHHLVRRFIIWYSRLIEKQT